MSTSPTRPIRTSTQQVACDVCGRTLLRGERVEIYLAGTSRHSVCELCTSRALHGGWVREGTVPDYGEAGDGQERRRSRLLRRRRRRATPASESEPDFPPMFADDLDGDFDDDDDLTALAAEPEPLKLSETPEQERGPVPEWPDSPPRTGRRGRRARSAPLRFRQDAPREPVGAREPRHVHAVPTSVEHKIDAAVDLFDRSEHPRTVSGIARSLGLPDVSVYPASPVAAIVNVVISWELCWYRYEIDLSEPTPVVRNVGQGYELSELSELERQANVSVDENGMLSPT